MPDKDKNFGGSLVLDQVLESDDVTWKQFLKSARLPPMWAGFDSRTAGVIGWFSLLLVLVIAQRVFLRVLRFSPLLKNKHF